jgi:prepilin-type N-terminal cleavage/methylation domain-containing protein
MEKKINKKKSATVKKKTNTTVKKKSNNTKKKGFTLIELLAVIIILGILMIIAIPSVTSYISDSRKNAYIDTAKEIVGGARNVVNEGRLGMYDTNTTYYIPADYIKTENASKSPYGEFTEAYVGVVYDGTGYKYYWISTDNAGQGVKEITLADKLETDDIVSDLKDTDITNVVETTGIGNRKKIMLLNTSTETWNEVVNGATNFVSEETGANIVCKPATSLHTKPCQRESLGCAIFVGSGNTITYGTIPNGTPKAGDAFDCKVTENGDYTERFYYIKSEGKNSILIYYKNMNDQTAYAYNSNNQNYRGPQTAYQALPSTSVWNNPDIIAPGTRQIVTQDGGTNAGGKTVESFTYTDKAARLLTTQELIASCSGMTRVGTSNSGELIPCSWLLENTGVYESTSGLRSGFWLETPRSDDSIGVWDVYSLYAGVGANYANDSVDDGVRPVITIKTASLLY